MAVTDANLDAQRRPRQSRSLERTSARAANVFVVLNPISGSSDPDTARSAFERHVCVAGAVCRIHEPSPGERLADLVREAVRSGSDLVVAAGGDGTVSAVANGLVGSGTPLGIIPLGTANVLARELGIPVDLEQACALLGGDHALAVIDAMEVDGKAYLTQVGVGIDALMIRDTTTEDKRRFGRLAYIWTAASRLVGFQPRRFELTADGRGLRVSASQVLVANCGVLGQPPFRWGPDIVPDDGVIDVCVIRARSLWDYARIGWNFVTGRHRQDPNVRYLKVRDEVTIAMVSSKPLPVQADGEIIGQTPVTVRNKPAALKVVVPVTTG
jgi:YegS/Rv2252/BmrU family lipid kinase